MRPIVLSSLSIGMVAAFPLAFAVPNHLAPPLLYDNASALYGQTFVAEESSLRGVRFYIGDPTRPNDPIVDALTGIADLVLFDATDLATPVEIARARVQDATGQTFGLTTFSFISSVPVSIGGNYFIALDTQDSGFGLGLRSQFSSTYDGGFEGRINSFGTIESASGSLLRDTSFEVFASSVPEPATWLTLAVGLSAVASRRTQRPQSTGKL